MSDSRILILEGYDASPLGSMRESTRHAAHREVEWNACKVGRKVEVYKRGGMEQSPSVACTNNTRFFVVAKTKKKAHKLAVSKFREERAEKRTKRLGSISPDQSAAQQRFAAAAHACRVKVGSGGNNRSYLSCMRQKLTK